MKRLIYLISFFFISSLGFTQETVFEEKTTIYSSELSGGVGIHTNGFMGTFRFGKFQSAFSKRIIELEIANIKHPKEIKSIYPFEDNVRGYIYGKMNSVFTFRPSIGFHKIIVPKQSIKGVSITLVTQVGVSLGFAKPVYLNIIERESSSNSNIIVKRKFDPEKHDQGDIYGRASFLNGFNEIQVYPGIFGKFGFQFDFAGDLSEMRALEAGVKIDAYFQEIPIMAFTENRAIYPNLYIAFFIGSREVK
ncbi:MAG: hypothetical protein RJQ00_00740 [Vicingaceae bacterium]